MNQPSVFITTKDAKTLRHFIREAYHSDYRGGDYLKGSAGEIEKAVIEVNLIGQAFGAMAALPHVKRAECGALVPIGSVESKRGLPLHSAYSASKHRMIGFINALRGDNLRVCP